MAITDSWLRATNGKLQDSITTKSDRDCLSARVSLKGKITFQLRFRIQGKQQRVDMGTYPLISLKSARAEALRYRIELEKGHDPRIIKKTEKLKNIEAVTLDDIFSKWFNSWCIENKKGASEIKRSFELHILPTFGNIPPDKISADKWMTSLEELKKNTPAISERLLINTKQMLSWALRRKLIDKNELESITAKRDLGITKRPRTRSLSDEEISMVLIAVDKSKMAYKNKRFIRLCLIYGCRNGELRLAKAIDFDFEAMVWTIPPQNHKTGETTGEPLIRPIIKETNILIKECIAMSTMTEYIFCHQKYDQPMDKSIPITFPYCIMKWLNKHNNYQMPHWSMHDLRKTARTNFSTLTQPHIAEIMLGHRLPGVWQTYDQHLYLQEQAECLKGWVKRLNDIESNSNPA